MTLHDFEQRLRKVDPRFRVRQRGHGDIVGIFHGNDYIARCNKGELNLNGYRFEYFTDKLEKVQGNIQKRGRKTLVKMLARYLKDPKDRACVLWGIPR